MGNSVFAQSSRIRNFSLSQSGNQVAYHFIFTAGNSCNGYQLMHSSDSITYMGVFDYAGICGASGADEPFSGLHTTPVMNAWNFYKIQLATFETSEVERIYVSNTGAQKVIVYPNPSYLSADVVKYRISGVNNIHLQGFIYDQKGITRKFIDEFTIGDSSTLNLLEFENGLYFLWLTDGSKLYKGKFLLIR